MDDIDKEFLDRKTETSGCNIEEYKLLYPRLMNEHITTGVPGRNELQFIKREKENHTIILEGLKKTMIKISDFDYRRKHFDPIEENFGQENFLNTMKGLESMRDNHELIIEYLKTKKSELKIPPDNNSSPFSVLEWATIFYYADSAKYFNQQNTEKKIDFFRQKHEITTSKNTFKNHYYALKKAINKTNTYSIDNLNSILPFIIKNYNNGVVKIENDKIILKEEQKNKSDY